MDYMKFVNYHRETNADITIGALPNTAERAKEFGLMKIDDDRRIIVSLAYVPLTQTATLVCSLLNTHHSSSKCILMLSTSTPHNTTLQGFTEKPKTQEALDACRVDTTVLGE